MSRRRLDIVLAGAAVVFIVAFWKFRLVDPAAAFGPQSGDAFAQIYPMWVRAAAWMREGILPLWNPYQMCGHPFHAAVLYGIFYPLNAARLLLPPDVAMEVTIVVHLFAAWCFMYAYARGGLELEPLGSAVAATTFALSGFVVYDAVWFLPAVGAAVWIPLAFLALEKILDARGVQWVVLLAMATAMPILAGWLQTWMHTMQAIGLYVVVRLATLAAQRRWADILRAGILLSLGLGAGLALAAVQLLPSFELQRMGWRRPGGLSLIQQLAYGPTPPSMLARDAVDPTPSYPRQSYLGMLALIVLPLSVVPAIMSARTRPRVAGLWVVLVWGVGVAISVFGPFFTIYRMLPGGTWFRVPARAIYLYAFAGSALVGIAMSAIATVVDHSRMRRTRIVVVAAITALALAVVTRSPRAIVLLAVGIVAVTALAFAWGKFRRVAAASVVVVIAADLFCATYDTAARPFGHLELFDDAKAVFDFVQERQGLGRTFVDHPWPFAPGIVSKQGTIRGIFMIGDYEVLSTERFGRYCAAMNAGPGAPDASQFIGICRFNDVRGRIRLLERLGTRFVIEPKQFPQRMAYFIRAGWPLVFNDAKSGLVVLENPHPLPRAYVTYDPVVVRDADEALRRVTDPLEPVTAVFLEQDSLDGPPPPGQRGPLTRANIIAYEPNRVAIDTTADGDGFLVLTDSFYPGWRAYVDGRRQPIARANYLFRAVRVSAGSHHVEFRFVPMTFWLGALVSAVTGVFLCAVCWFDRRSAVGRGGSLAATRR